MKDIIIIGGGVAGLVSAINLVNHGLNVLVIEKNSYPSHKVCGEYVSNEVKPFLESLDAFPDKFNPPEISRFVLTSCQGRSCSMPLDLGGFGISRYTLDQFLFEKATNAGVKILLNTQVDQVTFTDDSFYLQLSDGSSLTSHLVIGCQGKQSKIDRALERDFLNHKGEFIGVKYHIQYDFPDDTIALHNFKGGYCGICKIDGDKYNLCYLGQRKDLQRFGNIKRMEEEILYQNPHLEDIFNNADFLFGKAMMVTGIGFVPKGLIENHVLMCGDSAGVITPLCGNGIALAIHAAKIVSELIIEYYRVDNFDRARLEAEYSARWKKLFAFRLKAGPIMQNLFGNGFSTEIAVMIMKYFKPVARYMMSQTHGKPF